jgi:hypothetical protein
VDFELSDERRAFQETAREFARSEWLPQAPGWDQREEFPVAGPRIGAGWERFRVSDRGKRADLLAAVDQEL